MYKASIDIGSNSILLLIASFEDGEFKELVNLARVTALGKDLDKTGRFHIDSMYESLKVLKEYRKEIDKYDVSLDNTIVTATEASRVASNAGGFYEDVKKETGFDVSIINAQGEAHYTALGVCKGSSLSSQDELTIMDIGGASTELIRVQTTPFKILSTISLPVGSVRGNDWINEGTFQEKVEDLLKQYDVQKFSIETLVCVAGSMTALGGMILGLTSFEANKVNGSNITFDNFCKFTDKLSELDSETILKQYPFLGKRAQTIVAGARVARAMGINLNIKNMEISTLGLRYGTLSEGTVEARFL